MRKFLFPFAVLLLASLPVHAMTTARTAAINFGTLPVTQGTPALPCTAPYSYDCAVSVSQWRTVYFLPIYNVEAGETIMAYAEGQATNDLGYNVELAELLEFRQTVQEDIYGGVSHVISGGTEQPIDTVRFPINGGDFSTSYIHHMKWSKSDIFVADKHYDVLYLAARLRARSTGAGAHDSLTVDAGQGQLYYLRF